MQPKRSRLTDTENKLVVTDGKRDGRRGNPGVGVWEAKPLSVRQAPGWIIQHREIREYFITTVSGN